MSSPAVNIFTSWNLSSEEELNGQVLNLSQKQVMQNRLAFYAAQRLAVKIDPQNPLAAVQEDAELQGQIGLMQLILAESDLAEKTLRQLATLSAQQ